MKESPVSLLLEKWETQRALKNLMGKYANCIILNREAEIYEKFWSNRQDICLGFNQGWFTGPESIRAYYHAVHQHTAEVAAVLCKAFPEQTQGKTPDEMYGIGEFKVRPLYAPVIEVADDLQTAQGLWYSMGTEARVGTAGPVAYWLWGYYAVDFILEDGTWKLWHMQYLTDVECICGQSWGEPARPYPDLPEFEALRGYAPPAPTIPSTLRSLYTPRRRLALSPRIPQPYTTFAETQSYGMEA